MTFGCCFLISKHHENCNGMASFIVIRHLPLQHGTLLFSVQLNVLLTHQILLFEHCIENNIIICG